MQLRKRFAAIAAAALIAVLSGSTAAQLSLTTTFLNNNGQSGNMFDVVASTPIILSTFDVNVASGTWNIEVYTVIPDPNATGTMGSMQQNANTPTDPTQWNLVATVMNVTSAGPGNPTPLGAGIVSINLAAGETRGLYITVVGATTMNYTNGANFQGAAASDTNLTINEGFGVAYAFGGMFGGPTPGSASRIWNGTIYYGPALADDLWCEKLVTPVTPPDQCDVLGNAETVTVQVRNAGLNTIAAGTPVTFAYFVDNGAATFELHNLANTLMTGQTEQITFNGTINLSTPGMHNVQVFLTYAPDQNAANDSISVNVNSPTPTYLSNYPVMESLDTFGAVPGSSAPPPLYEQETTDGATDWLFETAAAPNNGQPGSDHSGTGFYAYCDDTNTNESAVSLRSPCLDLAAIANPALKFWLYSNNTNTGGPTVSENFLHIDAITYPGGIPVLDIVPPIGHLGPGWQAQIINLSAFLGQVIQIRFRAQMDGGSNNHHIAIDDIEFFNLVVSNGQAPQPGLAEFDINNAVDGNNLPVSFGSNGPFSANARAGDPFTMTFTGQPDQPIVLLAGPLSTGLALFPGVGQLDIGTGLDPMTGLPTGITVVGDGTQPTLPDFFFRLQVDGTQTITFPTPPLPLGNFLAFQALILTGGPTVLAASNAVDVTIVP